MFYADFVNRKINQSPACVNVTSVPCKLHCTSPDDDKLQKSKLIDGCLKYFLRKKSYIKKQF
jgi:hypothetical protein